LTTTFSPRVWAVRFAEAKTERRANELLDSGYSHSLALTCDCQLLALYRELFDHLADVTLTPADLFDRPQYAAVVAAVHEAARLEGGAP
jgi:hypothetical protein